MTTCSPNTDAQGGIWGHKSYTSLKSLDFGEGNHERSEMVVGFLAKRLNEDEIYKVQARYGHQDY